MESTLMLFTATMLVRSYRVALTLSTGWRNTSLPVTTFIFLLFIKRAPTIIERVKIISPATGDKHPRLSNETSYLFSAFLQSHPPNLFSNEK